MMRSVLGRVLSVSIVLLLLMPVLGQAAVAVPNGFDAFARGKPTGDNPNKPVKPSDPTEPTPEPTTTKYALVIGISNYDGWGYDLQYCDDDARDMASQLQKEGYTVHTLIDGQASYSNILSEIAWLRSAEKAGDYVAFTYSGHGIKSGKDSNMLTKELSYLSSSKLASEFSSFDSSHIFFFFDACQIGAMSKVGGSGRYVAMASTTSSYSYDGTSSMSNGVFTYYFLYGMQNLGYTAVEEAFSYAESRSEATYPMSCVSSDGFTGLMYL